MSLSRNLRWLIRHPGDLPGLARGLTMRDLVLRRELAAMGVGIPGALARGLGRFPLHTGTVARLRRTFPATPPATLVDVGAQYGQFSLATFLAFPGCRVAALEPLPEAFEVLRELAGRLEALSAFPVAAGDADGDAVIHRSRNPGSSSLLAMRREHEDAFPETGTVDDIPIRVRTLDGVLEAAAFPIRRPVVLKLDVQGFEDRVLAGATRTLGEVDAIVLEMSLVPLYEGQLLFEPLKRLVEDAGFRYAGEFDRIRSPSTDEVCQVDGLFLGPAAPEAWRAPAD